MRITHRVAVAVVAVCAFLGSSKPALAGGPHSDCVFYCQVFFGACMSNPTDPGPEACAYLLAECVAGCPAPE